MAGCVQTETVEEPIEEEEEEEEVPEEGSEEEVSDEEDAEATVEEEKKPKTKKVGGGVESSRLARDRRGWVGDEIHGDFVIVQVEKTTWDWVLVNDTKPIWLRK